MQVLLFYTFVSLVAVIAMKQRDHFRKPTLEIPEDSRNKKRLLERCWLVGFEGNYHGSMVYVSVMRCQLRMPVAIRNLPEQITEKNPFQMKGG